MARDDKTKNVVLTVLLVIVVILLILSLLRRCSSDGLSAGASAPDNRIDSGTTVVVPSDSSAATGAASDSASGSGTSAGGSAASATSQASGSSAGSTASSASDTGSAPSTATTTTPSNSASTVPSTSVDGTTTIDLYGRHPEENVAFSLGNMFPGDSETGSFRVFVSHADSVTVNFHADVAEGSQTLAEVLNVRVELPELGVVLYDGLMRDMPESASYVLRTGATDELHYEITAYLDTSVGNDYQNVSLVADFTWWVDETGSDSGGRS